MVAKRRGELWEQRESVRRAQVVRGTQAMRGTQTVRGTQAVRGTQRQGASPVRDWGADTVGCQSLHKSKGQVERSKDTIWTEIQPLGAESTGAPALKETKYLSKI